MDLDPVIVTSSRARLPLRMALDHDMPDVHVMARTEIPPDVELHRLATIGG
jgi:flagellar biosynthesis protein FlhA